MHHLQTTFAGLGNGSGSHVKPSSAETMGLHIPAGEPGNFVLCPERELLPQSPNQESCFCHEPGCLSPFQAWPGFRLGETEAHTLLWSGGRGLQPLHQAQSPGSGLHLFGRRMAAQSSSSPDRNSAISSSLDQPFDEVMQNRSCAAELRNKMG